MSAKKKIALALTVALGFGAILHSVHDYPQTRHVAVGFAAGERPGWQVAFYFLNEAGAGLRYAVTGNTRHMHHFPSEKFLREAFRADFDRLRTLAYQGGISAQIRLAEMYRSGIGVMPDGERASFWFAVVSLRAEENEDAIVYADWEKWRQLDWRLRGQTNSAMRELAFARAKRAINGVRTLAPPLKRQDGV